MLGGDRLDLAALSFDGRGMQPKSSVFHPNYFLLKGKVEIGRKILSIYPVWYVMRKDSIDSPNLGR